LKLKFFISLVLSLLAVSQVKSQAIKKGDFLLNFGLANSAFYNKAFDIGLKSENGFIYPKTQSPKLLLDLNFIYFIKNRPCKIKPLIGFAYSPQGFNETGKGINDSNKIIDYRLPVVIDFISLYGGVYYPIIQKNKVTVIASQTFNPMINIWSTLNVFKTLAFSTRCNLLINIQLKNNSIVSLNPFFQTCITKFNKSKYSANSPNYYPFSFGFTIGSYFKD
jgi:hypothetical protein